MFFFSHINPSAVWSPYKAQGPFWQEVTLNQVFNAFISPLLASPGKAVVPPWRTGPQQLKVMEGWRHGEGVLWTDMWKVCAAGRRSFPSTIHEGGNRKGARDLLFPLQDPVYSRDVCLGCTAGWVQPVDETSCWATWGRAGTVTNTPLQQILRCRA